MVFKERPIPKEFVCYSRDEAKLPEYFPKHDISKLVYKINEGDYIETEDKMVVQIIRVWDNFFRIASKKAGTYSKWHVKKGQKVYFDPPPENKAAYEYSAWGRRGQGKRLTRMQRRFCRAFVKTGDEVEALRLAGYKMNDNNYDIIFSSRLLKMEKIKKGITEKEFLEHFHIDAVEALPVIHVNEALEWISNPR